MSQVNIKEVIERVRALRKKNVQEAPDHYWADFISLSTVLCSAHSAALLAASFDDQSHVAELTPISVATHDSLNKKVPLFQNMLPANPDYQRSVLLELATRCMSNGFAVQHEQDPNRLQGSWVGIRLCTDDSTMLLQFVLDSHRDKLGEILLRGQLLADVMATNDASFIKQTVERETPKKTFRHAFDADDQAVKEHVVEAHVAQDYVAQEHRVQEHRVQEHRVQEHRVNESAIEKKRLLESELYFGEHVAQSQQPHHHQQPKQPQQTSHQHSQQMIMDMLPLVPELYRCQTLPLAGYALVNGLVAQANEVDMAMLGWRDGEYVKIAYLSHFDRFSRKAELTKCCEAALEEAVDQRKTVVLSQAALCEKSITIAHQQLKKNLGCEDLLTLPINNREGEPMGALLLVNMSHPFSSASVPALEFVSALIEGRIESLMAAREASWWNVQGIKQRCYRLAKFLVGKEWITAKLVSLFAFLLFGWLLLGSLSFRIESTGEFITDQTQLISAPIEGVVADVDKKMGDSVVKGERLIQLKKQDLLLQRTELEAEKQRFASEADKARASGNIVEMEIAMARHAQVDASIQRTLLKLEDTRITAPFDGVLIDGDRKDLLGAPVRKGDLIMKLAQIEGIYLTLLIDESDIHHVNIGDPGEFALVSQPLDPLPFEVEALIPVATNVAQKGAQFMVKAKLLVEPQAWWRPGMTGVAKIDKGDARPIWVLGRKSWHRLRLMFWW